MKIADIAGLSRLRHIVGRLDHDDETLAERVVILTRHGLDGDANHLLDRGARV